MSSVNSRHTPEVGDHLEALRDAVVEVAESSFFAFVDPCDAAHFAEIAEAVPSWLEAAVTFSGAFGGRLVCGLAEPLADELFASFLGLAPQGQPADVMLFDLVGELGNMICGSWLTRACQRRRFDLEHPEVVRTLPPLAPLDDVALRVAVNGQPLWIRLTFSEE
jgi:CheY-specific phosphatase CheX